VLFNHLDRHPTTPGNLWVREAVQAAQEEYLLALRGQPFNRPDQASQILFGRQLTFGGRTRVGQIKVLERQMVLTVAHPFSTGAVVGNIGRNPMQEC